MRFLVVQCPGLSPPTSETQAPIPGWNTKTLPATQLRKKGRKKEKRMNRQNPRTNGKSKPIQTKSHKETYTYTLTKREKGGKNTYIKKEREQPPQ